MTLGRVCCKPPPLRLSAMESKVLKRNIAGSREEILEMRRE
jgi:hypothetical protein